MSEAVFDASAVCAELLHDSGSERLEQLYESYDVHAPDRLDEECANAIWKRFMRGDLSGDDVAGLMDDLRRFAIERHPYTTLLPVAVPLAIELRHPVYDCLYILLALSGGRVLVTADAQMREAAESVGVKVEWVGAD